MILSSIPPVFPIRKSPGWLRDRSGERSILMLPCITTTKKSKKEGLTEIPPTVAGPMIVTSWFRARVIRERVSRSGTPSAMIAIVLI